MMVPGIFGYSGPVFPLNIVVVLENVAEMGWEEGKGCGMDSKARQVLFIFSWLHLNADMSEKKKYITPNAALPTID